VAFSAVAALIWLDRWIAWMADGQWVTWESLVAGPLFMAVGVIVHIAAKAALKESTITHSMELSTSSTSTDDPAGHHRPRHHAHGGWRHCSGGVPRRMRAPAL
jgi:hypothetical protein